MADKPFRAVASIKLDGNTYESAPISFAAPADFVAKVLQLTSPGTYEFELVQVLSTRLNAIVVTNECSVPVTFVLEHEGRPAGVYGIDPLANIVIESDAVSAPVKPS
jgi:hypothetical protein